MKQTIWRKYVLAAIVYVVGVGLLINLIGFWLARKSITETYRTRLRDVCRTLSVEYVRESRYAGLTAEQFELQLESVSEMLGAEVWIIDDNGKILMTTEKQLAADKEEKLVPKDVLNSNWNARAEVPELFDGQRAIAVDSVASGVDLWGYVAVSIPQSRIRSEVFTRMMPVNIVAITIGLLALALWFLAGLYHSRTVRTLLDATMHYTNGEFENEINIRSQDEYRDLGNTIHLLADQHANLVEYQKNFIANISHDFRSPLTSIKGYAEAIKDGTIPYEIQGKYLNIILFETDRLANLTNDLLDLSNFENKGVHLSFSQFDITKMLKQSAMTFEGKCSQKNLKIRLAFPENTLTVYADKGKIQQVVHNLIDNAIKFSHPDGIIYVSVMERREKVLVSVRDTGIGIPKESINKVWERFYKTDLSRGKDKRGTGLGLSITKQIIAAHNENIKVSSTEGVGTEFVFSLAKVDT